MKYSLGLLSFMLGTLAFAQAHKIQSQLQAKIPDEAAKEIFYPTVLAALEEEVPLREVPDAFLQREFSPEEKKIRRLLQLQAEWILKNEGFGGPDQLAEKWSNWLSHCIRYYSRHLDVLLPFHRQFAFTNSEAYHELFRGLPPKDYYGHIYALRELLELKSSKSPMEFPLSLLHQNYEISKDKLDTHPDYKRIRHLVEDISFKGPITPKHAVGPILRFSKETLKQSQSPETHLTQDLYLGRRFSKEEDLLRLRIRRELDLILSTDRRPELPFYLNEILETHPEHFDLALPALRRLHRFVEFYKKADQKPHFVVDYLLALEGANLRQERQDQRGLDNFERQILHALEEKMLDRIAASPAQMSDEAFRRLLAAHPEPKSMAFKTAVKKRYFEDAQNPDELSVYLNFAVEQGTSKDHYGEILSHPHFQAEHIEDLEKNLDYKSQARKELLELLHTKRSHPEIGRALTLLETQDAVAHLADQSKVKELLEKFPAREWKTFQLEDFSRNYVDTTDPREAGFQGLLEDDPHRSLLEKLLDEAPSFNDESLARFASRILRKDGKLNEDDQRILRKILAHGAAGEATLGVLFGASPPLDPEEVKYIAGKARKILSEAEITNFLTKILALPKLGFDSLTLLYTEFARSSASRDLSGRDIEAFNSRFLSHPQFQYGIPPKVSAQAIAAMGAVGSHASHFEPSLHYLINPFQPKVGPLKAPDKALRKAAITLLANSQFPQNFHSVALKDPSSDVEQKLLDRLSLDLYLFDLDAEDVLALLDLHLRAKSEIPESLVAKLKSSLPTLKYKFTAFCALDPRQSSADISSGFAMLRTLSKLQQQNASIVDSAKLLKDCHSAELIRYNQDAAPQAKQMLETYRASINSYVQNNFSEGVAKNEGEVQALAAWLNAAEHARAKVLKISHHPYVNHASSVKDLDSLQIEGVPLYLETAGFNFQLYKRDRFYKIAKAKGVETALSTPPYSAMGLADFDKLLDREFENLLSGGLHEIFQQEKPIEAFRKSPLARIVSDDALRRIFHNLYLGQHPHRATFNKAILEKTNAEMLKDPLWALMGEDFVKAQRLYYFQAHSDQVRNHFLKALGEKPLAELKTSLPFSEFTEQEFQSLVERHALFIRSQVRSLSEQAEGGMTLIKNAMLLYPDIKASDLLSHEDEVSPHLFGAFLEKDSELLRAIARESKESSATHQSLIRRLAEYTQKKVEGKLNATEVKNLEQLLFSLTPRPDNWVGELQNAFKSNSLKPISAYLNYYGSRHSWIGSSGDKMSLEEKMQWDAKAVARGDIVNLSWATDEQGKINDPRWEELILKQKEIGGNHIVVLSPKNLARALTKTLDQEGRPQIPLFYGVKLSPEHFEVLARAATSEQVEHIFSFLPAVFPEDVKFSKELGRTFTQKHFLHFGEHNRASLETAVRRGLIVLDSPAATYAKLLASTKSWLKPEEKLACLKAKGREACYSDEEAKKARSAYEALVLLMNAGLKLDAVAMKLLFLLSEGGHLQSRLSEDLARAQVLDRSQDLYAQFNKIFLECYGENAEKHPTLALPASIRSELSFAVAQHPQLYLPSLIAQSQKKIPPTNLIDVLWTQKDFAIGHRDSLPDLGKTEISQFSELYLGMTKKILAPDAGLGFKRDELYIDLMTQHIAQHKLPVTSVVDFVEKVKTLPIEENHKRRILEKLRWYAEHPVYHKWSGKDFKFPSELWGL
jgi:hypothetical protein